MELFLAKYKKRFRDFFLSQSFSRKYEIGDDLAHLDPFLSAKRGVPFIKQYRECRDVDLILVLDVSCSQFYGRVKSKYDSMCDFAEMIRQLAENAGDRVGVVIFSGKVKKYLVPSHKTCPINYLLSEFEGDSSSTDPLLVANFLRKILKKSSVVLWISDFIYPDKTHNATMRGMKLIAKKHDLICLQITDFFQDFCTDCLLQDAESGEVAVHRGSDKKHSRYLADLEAINCKKLKADMKNLGIKFVQVSTIAPTDAVLEECLDKHLA